LKPKHVIDLTLDIVGQGVAWPGAPLPEVVRAGYLAKDGFNVEIVRFTTHTSTHLDAPMHMVESLPTIDALPIEGPASEGTWGADLGGRPRTIQFATKTG
jgi:kynurenine formamidase